MQTSQLTRLPVVDSDYSASNDRAKLMLVDPTSAARNLRNRLYEDQEDISPLRPAWEGPKLVGLVSLDDILDLLSEGFAEIGRLMRNEAPSSLAEL